MSHLKDGDTENGESAPMSNGDLQSEAATISVSKSHLKQHLEEQKKPERKSDMTLEDMYNSQYDFGDDEDEDSDWEPALQDRIFIEIPKRFCLNCTMDNLEADVHCALCGEHTESGILKRGFLASPFSREQGFTENVAHAAVGVEDTPSQSIASGGPTAIGFDERMLLHEEVEMKARPHPERPNRLRAIAASLATAGIFPGRCSSISAREITTEELQMVHSLENIEAVELTSHALSSYFTPDTYANQYSARAARLAAGLCFDLATAICSGSAKNGFALVRPPGHHAGVKQAMGFCLHNNAAIAASAAQIAGAKKVLIIDWDVHHGNGTQEIFEKSKSVLYVSLHRHEGGKFYPGTGAADEVGTMGAEGYCVNVPWSRGGVGDDDYVFAFQQVVLPIASEFDPDFTIISAGFDAAQGDPLGGCDITPTGYAQMTQMCSALSGGKLLVILEGGYNLRSISSSATAVIKVLLGEGPEHNVEQLVPTKAGVRTVLEVLKIQINYWPSLVPKFSEVQSEWGWYALQETSKKISLQNLWEHNSSRNAAMGGASRPRPPVRKGTDRTCARTPLLSTPMNVDSGDYQESSPLARHSKRSREGSLPNVSRVGRGKGLFLFGANQKLGAESLWDALDSKLGWDKTRNLLSTWDADRLDHLELEDLDRIICSVVARSPHASKR